MKKLLGAVLGFAAAVALVSAPAEAAKRKKVSQSPIVEVEINISEQSMDVDVHGFSYANWKVSTARDGYYTPRGSYRVKRMAREYYSQKYDNSPMPYSVFFKGGYAIHGTNYLRSLGRPASHGCVRLHPRNAARLYALVQKYGMSRTRITLID
jgi:lipoprotein-anchoring transpeptidase ErfK/SrfK